MGSGGRGRVGRWAVFLVETWRGVVRGKEGDEVDEGRRGEGGRTRCEEAVLVPSRLNVEEVQAVVDLGS